MPNNTTNHLTVKASKTEFAKIKKFMSGEGVDKFFDFNKIIPMPVVLRNVVSPVNIVSEEEYKKAVDAAKDKKDDNEYCGLPITAEMQKEYLEKYGADNWYTWAIKHWGTKWGAYDEMKWVKNTLSFYTAWSPPMPVIEALSEKFPKATFTLEYADEGGEWCGTAVFKNGECEDTCIKQNNPAFNKKYDEITMGS